MRVDGPEHAELSGVREDVHGLNPPDHPVAPVAPLEGDERLTDGATIVLGDPVAAGRLFAQEGSDAGAQHFEIECQVFGLAGECEVARDDEVQVVDSGRSDVKHAGYLEGEGSERL